jgi:hypothetical protein
MVKIPSWSFGDWLGSHDLIWQIVFMQNFMVLPIFLIFYAALLGGRMVGVDTQATTLLSLFGGAIWFLMIKMWDLNNMQSATKQLPINMNIRYNKTTYPQEINVIKGHLKITEDYAKKKFSYAVSLMKPIIDVINKEPFQYFILNTPYNWDTTMSKVDKCMVAFNGSIFEGPAALINVAWMKDHRNIAQNDDGEYNIVTFRVFKLLLCPENGEEEQQVVGAISKDGEIEEINNAIKIFDTNNSIKTLMELNSEKNLNESLANQVKLSGEQALEHIGTFADNRRFIRQPNLLINWRSTKVRILLVLGAIALGAGAYWYLYGRPKV